MSNPLFELCVKNLHARVDIFFDAKTGWVSCSSPPEICAANENPPLEERGNKNNKKQRENQKIFLCLGLVNAAS